MARVMDCETIRRKRIAEDYRAGRLSPEDAEAYERHFLECDACFEDLRIHGRLVDRMQARGSDFFMPEIEAEKRGDLRAYALQEEQAPEGVAPSEQGSQTPPDRPTRGFRWILRRPAREPGPRQPRRRPIFLRPAWIGGLLAVATVILALVTLNENAQRTERFRSLLTLRAHPYIATGLRGGVDSPEFKRGVELYQEKHYRQAAEVLQTAAARSPESAEIRFYLGVSFLMDKRYRQARGALDAAVRLAPSSNLYRWYLAQAQLGSGRSEDAERLLRKLAASRGEFSAEADSLLEEIARLREE